MTELTLTALRRSMPMTLILLIILGMLGVLTWLTYLTWESAKIRAHQNEVIMRLLDRCVIKEQ